MSGPARDPVSWLVIERGWEVKGPGGDEIGRVDEVIGDKNADIFNGLALSEGLFKGRRYVPAERVHGIYEGLVEVDLTSEQVDALEHYDGETVS
ncbi:MAG: hypothetical protein QOE36_81 [Gaiellaceae bacterium]|jgi:uncharacterized protein YrrD|nr:hypothetical protein [Gaiellaceae bacterium]MDX6510577.1 hypothetical protein [Gaiellaceae bacterium]